MSTSIQRTDNLRTLLLDRERRWFDLVGEVKREPSSYEQVLEAIRHLTDEPIKRAVINAALEGRLDERTITRCLEIAVKRGELLKVKKGQYSRKAANADASLVVIIPPGAPRSYSRSFLRANLTVIGPREQLSAIFLRVTA